MMTKRRGQWLGACALLLAGTMGRAADTPPAPPVAAATPPTAEQFGRLPFMESPQLSPDGTRVAAQIALNGQLRMAIIPLGDTAHLKLINPGAADLNAWSWVNNDWLVVRIGQSSAVEGDSWYLRRAIAVGADGKNMRVLGADRGLGQNVDDVLWVARDGTPHVRLALQTSIYSNEPGFWPEVRDFDVSTGKSRLVAEAASRAEPDGFRVLRGQCVEFGADGMPLVPLVEALRTLARTTPPGQLDDFLGVEKCPE